MKTSKRVLALFLAAVLLLPTNGMTALAAEQNADDQNQIVAEVQTETEADEITQETPETGSEEQVEVPSDNQEEQTTPVEEVVTPSEETETPAEVVEDTTTEEEEAVPEEETEEVAEEEDSESDQMELTETSGDYTYTISGDYAEIAKYISSDAVVTVPSKYNGYTVNKIAANAFKDNKYVTKIVLPNTIETINNYAFSGCSNLESISLGNSVKTIGQYVFQNCTKLTEIIIPSTVTSMGYYSFDNGVKKVTFASGMEKIPNNACYGYYSSSSTIEEVVLPSTVKEIGSKSFYLCSSLKKINLNNVETINSSAFEGCTLLEDVDLNKTIYIGSSAFKNNKALTKAEIAPKAHVYSNAFYGCTNIESVVVGDGAVLESNAFAECSGIKSIVLGNDVDVKNGAFPKEYKGTWGTSFSWVVNTETKRLTITGSGAMPSIATEDDIPWKGLNALFDGVILDDKITTISNYAFKDCIDIDSITLPKGLKKIGKESFSGCSSFKFVEIPESVVSIDEKAFYDCPKLESIVFCGDAPAFGTNALPNQSSTTGFYPETKSGWTDRVFKKFDKIHWVKWDSTLPAHDVVLVLDVSGSMSSKMDNLKNAVNGFIYGAGGRMNNTRIAIVKYESSPTLVCDFTTDLQLLEQTINGLNSTGGTTYGTALTKADDLLNASDAKFRTVIMFSDGQPNDNKDNIYAIAGKMQQKYNMFTVGLVASSENTYREILINVAGREDHYFEATNVDALVQAFLDLVQDINRQDDTTVEIKRHNTRRDLLTSKEKFCLNSDEEVSLYITPGNLRGNIRQVSVVQDGKTILSNDTGTFEDIKPGRLFESGKEIYAELYNTKGLLVESLDLGIVMCDTFQISYMMNNGVENEEYFVQNVIGGESFDEPEEPTLSNYRFMGWYTSESCNGFSFFDPKNYYNRLQLEDDLVLFAKWKKENSFFDMKEDGYSFYNKENVFVKSDFVESDRANSNYEMTNGDRGKLLDAAKAYGFAEKTKIKKLQASPWYGDCFGISASAVLLRQGIINISDFDSSAATTYEAKIPMNTQGDKDVSSLESMINYYQLMQEVGSLATISHNYSSVESDNIQAVMNKLKTEKYPMLLNIKLFSGTTEKGNHTVVAFNYKEVVPDEEYTFDVYDSSLGIYDPATKSDNTFPVTIRKTGDAYFCECSEWESAWIGWDVFIKNVITLNDLLSESILTSPGIVNFEASGSSKEEYEITTSYGDFSISDGIDMATISNGQKISGSLSVRCLGNKATPGNGTVYSFLVPALSSGSYSIVMSGYGDNNTTIYYGNKEKGFYDEIDAANAGTIEISADGQVQTHFTSATKQTIVLSKNGSSTDWYVAEFEGTSTGYTAKYSQNQAEITAEDNGKVDITLETDFNEISFTDIELGTQKLTVSKDSDTKATVVKKGDTVVSSKQFGYAVLFDSQQGSDVDPITNLNKGDLVKEPLDPRREGFIFQGWYKEKTCSNAWDFEKDTIEKDTVLYAGWSLDANYYVTATFNLGGIDAQRIYVGRGSLIDVEKCPPIAVEYDQNWYIDDEFTTPWVFEVDEVLNNVVLYAKGQPYEVKFDTVKSTTKISSITVFGGKRISEPTAPSYKGYTMCGWYLDPEYKNQWDFKKDKVTGNTTLYARWIPNELDKNNQDTLISIEQIQADKVVFTGKPVEVKVIVRDNGKQLKAGVDYKITYKNNTNACDIKTTLLPANKLPQFSVVGLGDYKAAKAIVKNFSIYQAPMKDLKIEVPDGVAVKANDALQKVAVAVKTSSGKALGAKEYTVSYYKDAACKQKVDGITAVGTYYVSVEAAKDATGVYAGNVKGVSDPIKVLAVTADKMFAKAAVKTVAKTMVKETTADAVITELITSVKFGQTEYKPAADLAGFKKLFAVSAKDENGKVYDSTQLAQALTYSGKRTFTIKPSASNPGGFIGERSFTVQVDGIKLTSKMFVVTYAPVQTQVVTSIEYTGSLMRPNVFTNLEEDKDYKVTYFLGKKEIKAHQMMDAGSYKLTMTGINKYSGSVSYNVTINKVDIAKAYKELRLSASSNGAAIYSMDGAVSKVALSYDADGTNGTAYKRIMMTEGDDFTVAYKNNGFISGYYRKYQCAYAVVTGKGNYKGTLKGDGTKAGAARSNKSGIANELNYSVNKKPLTSPDMTYVVNNYIYKKGKITSASVDVYDNGKKVASKQYKVTASSSGTTATIRVNSVSIKNGKGFYSGSSANITAPTYLVKATDTAKVIVALASNDKYYYTGESICPKVDIRDKMMTDISSNFDITYGENKKVGIGTVTIKGKVDKGYCGQKVIKFTILPKWMAWMF